MFELLVIFALVLINAVLSGTEMAVVSVRRARLQTLADDGNRNARLVLALRTDPERFLATVQVGITLVGAIAGAFGGQSLAAVVEPLVATIPGCESSADEIAFGVVVVLITFLSVVFGELIPKSLALRHAEAISLWMARPIRFLERLARPINWVLVRSSNLVLGLFRDSTNFVESKLSREDLAAMVREAANQSDLSSSSRDMFQRAVEFPTLRVADVMIHRRDVVAIAADASPEALRQAIVERGHRRMPVYEGSLDHVIGYVLRDDVIPRLWDGKPIVLRELLRPARFVPENMPADRALRDLQARRAHLVIVADEHGGVAGIVTMEDLVEELVGEIFSENDVGVTETAKRQADGSWLVQGNLGIREFARLADLDLEGPESVRSMGGLIVHLAGGMLPGQGDRFRWEGNVELEAVEVTARRVRLVRVRLV